MQRRLTIEPCSARRKSQLAFGSNRTTANPACAAGQAKAGRQEVRSVKVLSQLPFSHTEIYISHLQKRHGNPASSPLPGQSFDPSSHLIDLNASSVEKA